MAIAVAVVAGVLAVATSVGTGGAAADPTTTDPAPASTTDPAPADTTDPADSDSGEDKVKAGTPKEGQIHWDTFGDGADDAPQDLNSFSQRMVGYGLSIFAAFAVIGALVVCLLMVAGIRGRSQLARQALESSIWIPVAVIIVGSITEIAGLILTSALG